MTKFATVWSSSTQTIAFPISTGTIPLTVPAFLANPTMILPHSPIFIARPVFTYQVRPQHVLMALTMCIGLLTVPLVVALQTTYPTVTLNCCGYWCNIQPRLLTSLPVMALLSTYSTSESPIDGIFLKFGAIVSSMPFTATVFTVKFHSCIWQRCQLQYNTIKDNSFQ